MATPLNQRMRQAAALYTPLQALLGLSPFRWYFVPLQQGSTFPAISQQQISSNVGYTATARLATGWSRQQFTVWGGKYAAGETAMWEVSAALKSFWDQYSGGTGITGLLQYPNEVIGERVFNFVFSDTPYYRLVIDVGVFTDDRL